MVCVLLPVPWDHHQGVRRVSSRSMPCVGRDQPEATDCWQDFPGGLYMVMTLDHCFEEPFTRIPESWMRLHDWVIHHEKYQSASHQWLEELLHVDYGRTLKLYHPVMPVPG